MSTSSKRLLDYSKRVLNEEMLAQVDKRITEKLIAKFRKASPEQREFINACMDADAMFISELRTIVGEHEKPNPDDEEIVPVK